MQDFRKLLVWQIAHELAVNVILVTNQAERGHSSLIAQTRESAASVAANISEGTRRPTQKQFASFLGIAIGSLSETHNHLLLIRDAGILQVELVQPLISKVDRLRPMLFSLRTRVLNNPDKKGS
jgi:four helix bundle protein